MDKHISKPTLPGLPGTPVAQVETLADWVRRSSSIVHKVPPAIASMQPVEATVSLAHIVPTDDPGMMRDATIRAIARQVFQLARDDRVQVAAGLIKESFACTEDPSYLIEIFAETGSHPVLQQVTGGFLERFQRERLSLRNARLAITFADYLINDVKKRAHPKGADLFKVANKLYSRVVQGGFDKTDPYCLGVGQHFLFLRDGGAHERLGALANALLVHPNHPRLLLSYIAILGSEERTAEALPMLANIVTVQPDRPALWLVHARCAAALFHFDRAAPSFQAYLTAKPYDDVVRAEYAVTLMNNGDPKAAEAQARQAFELSHRKAGKASVGEPMCIYAVCKILTEGLEPRMDEVDQVLEIALRARPHHQLLNFAKAANDWRRSAWDQTDFAGRHHHQRAALVRLEDLVATAAADRRVDILPISYEREMVEKLIEWHQVIARQDRDLRYDTSARRHSDRAAELLKEYAELVPVSNVMNLLNAEQILSGWKFTVQRRDGEGWEGLSASDKAIRTAVGEKRGREEYRDCYRDMAALVARELDEGHGFTTDSLRRHMTFAQVSTVHMGLDDPLLKRLIAAVPYAPALETAQRRAFNGKKSDDILPARIGENLATGRREADLPAARAALTEAGLDAEIEAPDEGLFRTLGANRPGTDNTVKGAPHP